MEGFRNNVFFFVGIIFPNVRMILFGTQIGDQDVDNLPLIFFNNLKN